MPGLLLTASLLLATVCSVLQADSQPSCGSSPPSNGAAHRAFVKDAAFAASPPHIAGWAAEDHSHIYAHMSTKTPYRLVANPDTATPSFPNCQPLRIWSMIRHGTRLPKKRVFEELLRFDSGRLNELREAILRGPASAPLSPDARQMLRDWPEEGSFTRRLRDDGEGQHGEKDLAEAGWLEMVGLAERMQERWPELLVDVWRNETYRFKFTRTQRARRSFEAFAEGLFGRGNVAEVWHPEPSRADPVLRFYKACARWRHYKEHDLRSDAAAIARFHTSLLPRFAAFGLTSITTEDLTLLHDVCTFETAWQPAQQPPSPWCSLFSPDQMSAIDFQRDFTYFRRDGYARPLTYRQACPALNDMLMRLTSDREPPATFYFTHSGTILKMLALLQLYRDERPLELADWAEGRAEERRWRAGQMDAFGSNLAFVLYRCAAGEKSSDHLLVQHQERAVRLDGCPTDSDLCPLAQFRSVFRHALGKNCRFREMCAVVDDEEKKKVEMGMEGKEGVRHGEL